MSDFAVRLRIIILGILIVVSILVWWPQNVTGAKPINNLKVSFLDVGQGDAIHIVTPDNFEMLIDGGQTSSVLSELAKGRSFFDKEIDVMISTHPDSDHVAGLVDVLERFKVDMIIATEAESDAAAAVAFNNAAASEGARRVVAQAGQTVQLGASTTVYLLSPLGNTRDWETNTASVVVVVKYGETEFMLTGDAPETIEKYLVNQHGTTLQSEVLKLGHHGSKTSSSEEFLKMVNPDYAIVSAGKDNRYGHPHQEVVERVLREDIKLINTAERGTIIFESDGEKVWLVE